MKLQRKAGATGERAAKDLALYSKCSRKPILNRVSPII